MEKVKIKDKKTGAVKEVNKSLASDYIGTGRFEIAKKSIIPKEVEKPISLSKMKKEEDNVKSR